MPDKQHKTRMFVRKLKSIGFVDRGACEGADIILAKRADGEVEIMTESKIDHAAELEAAQKRIAELEAEIAAKSADEATEEDVLKGVPEEVQKRIADLEAAQKKAQAELEAERESRRVEGFVQKAAAEYKALPIEASAFGAVLAKCSRALSDGEFKELERVLKSADEAANTAGLFVAKGHAGTEVSAIDRINSIAGELVEKGEAKTHAEGVMKAAQRNPALYEEYVAAQRARV